MTADEQALAEQVTPLLDISSGTGVAVAARHGTTEILLVSGLTAAHDGHPVEPRTRFELGSLTKTFTALLLAEMATRGEVSYDDTIGQYLPPGAAPRLSSVTLRHLATHNSGLPRLPPGLLRSAIPSWYTNPYGAFGPQDVLTAVRRTRPRSAPGERVRYSNFAVGLLGILLARTACRPFDELLAERVLTPLGLADTNCATAPQATGYLHGRPRPPWEIPGLPGAGALRSTARDMLRYLTAHLSPATTPLAKALTEVARPRLPVPGADRQLCLVWNLRQQPGHDLLYHDGGTRGFSSFAGFSPQSRTALVALTNAAPTLRASFIQRSYEALRTLAAGQELAGTPEPIPREAP